MQVDAGYRIIGECAWHHSQHLQIVHPDDTVHSLQMRVFSRCYALRRVFAPGCRELGAQVFEECVALLQVGMNNDIVNQLAPQQAELAIIGWCCGTWPKHGWTGHLGCTEQLDWESAHEIANDAFKAC